jgi:hypothetical protein
VRRKITGMKRAQGLILLADHLIPDIPAAELGLVEPDLDPGCAQSVCDALRGLRIL